MIAEVVVLLSSALALAFVAAWALRPDLRTWIERPKHHFQAQLERYDRERRGGGTRGSRSA